MSWLTKISQTKSMPLPFGRQQNIPIYPSSGPTGTLRLDDKMSLDEAVQEEGRHPNMQNIGQGNFGTAYHDPDIQLVIKYTRSKDEFRNALKLTDLKIPCVAKIVSALPINDNVFKITMEKTTEIEGEKRDIVNVLYESIDMSFEDLRDIFPYAKLNEEKKQLVNDYIEMLHCLRGHGIDTYDTHAGNIGYTTDGRLVLFDVG